jgi:cell division transport system permease protein
VFLLVAANFEHLLAGWMNAAEMSVYLRDDVTQPARQAIDEALAQSDLVERREYVSKADALARFRRDFPELATVAAGLPENPLPASFEARLGAGARHGDAAERLAARLGGMPGVADVRYDRRWIDRLLTAVALSRCVGLFLAGILVLAAALTVANVVRLACHARRDEIEIMQLVGAPLVYVRGPFVAEGVVQGGLGAAIALLVLWAGFFASRARFGSVAAEVLGLERIAFLPLELCGWMLVGGMLVGCVGGFVAAQSARETPVTQPFQLAEEHVTR